MPTRRSGYNFAHGKKAAFLASFAQLGNITLACEAARIPRRSYYDYCEQDATFVLAVQQAKIEATERLEAEARRRAVEGVSHERPIFHGAEQVGSEIETKYSDVLLMFLLKGLAPEKYRERVDVTQTQVVKTLDAAAWDAV